jgi:hypothetical protein
MAKLLWTQRQDIGPRPRVKHGMAYDAARQRTLLFGGDMFGGHLVNDTWGWDGVNWTQLENRGPSERRGHAMTYDAARSRVVLFGGTSATGDMNDTWEWDGEAWTQMQNTGPAPRASHAISFNSARQRTVLFGGATSGVNGQPFNDTWEWDGSDWGQVDDGGPSPRASHAMAYDSVRARLVLFGGVGLARIGLADTWERDDAAWRQVQDFGPEGAFLASMVFRRNVTELFGGVSALPDVAAGRVFGLTWEWDGAHWTARQDIGVGARLGHAMAFDSARSRVVLFGGVTVINEDPNALRGDTWEHADVKHDGEPQPAGGGGIVGPSIQALIVEPNPARAQDALTITVRLNAPVTNVPTIVDIAITIGADPVIVVPNITSILIPAGIAVGVRQVLLPPGLDVNGVTPTNATVTARIGAQPAVSQVINVV